MGVIIVPIRTGRGQNARESWQARSGRVKKEREAVGWMLKRLPRPELPCIATLTRVAPSSGLDDDNLSGSLKAVRDEIARWIGVDDKKSDVVRYCYGQRRGEWGVEIEFGGMA